jgi:hypothetical protein
VLVTGPTAQAGLAIGTPTVSLAGSALDDVAVTALGWTNDRGGGGTLAPAAAWSNADAPLQPGDNRITVTAGDADGHTGSDTLG